MSDGYDIQLNLKTPTGGLDDYLKKLKSIEAKQKKMNAAAGASLPAGPAARYQKAIANLSTASAVGTPTQQFDAGAAVRRTRKAYEQAMKDASPATSSTMGDAFKKALMTSRIGIGPGGGLNLMPLVGKLGTFGPVGMAVTGLVTAFELLKGVADNASRSMGDFVSAGAAAGGQPYQTAMMSELGGAAGMTPQQAAAGAMEFAHDMANNPYAMKVFGKYGIQPDYDPGGNFNPDKATQYLKAVDAYLNKMDDQEALLAGHASPTLQHFAPLRHASPDAKAALMSDMRADAAYYGDPKNQEQAADYQVAQSRMQRAMTRAFGTAAARTLTPLYNSATSMIEKPTARNIGDTLLRLVGPGSALLGPLLKVVDANEKKNHTGPYEHVAGAGAEPPKRASSLDANTQAVHELTMVLKNQRQVFGGGERARGAVPAAWRMHVMDQAMQGGLARHLGAFVQ